MRYVVYAVAILSFASLMIVSIREDAAQPWTNSLDASTWTRWVVVGGLGALTELTLLVVAILLVWNLQMAPKQKWTIVSGFAARLVIIVPIAIRLVSLHERIDSTDFSFAYTIPALWTQAELHISLIAATIPCLRIFLKSLNTGYYGMNLDQIDPTATAMATKGGSYALSDLRSGGSVAANEKQTTSASRQVPGRTLSSSGVTTSKVTSRDRAEDSDSVASDRSDRRIFVRQTVRVRYAE